MSWLTNKISNVARKVGGFSSGMFGGLGSYFFRLPVAGVAVNEQTAMTYSAVYRCIKAITDPIMLMPFRVHKVSDGKRKIQSKHPVDWVLHRQANPEMSASTLKETLTAHALGWGNGYAEIERSRAGDVIGLWLITPDRVTPKRDNAGRFYYEVLNGDGTTVDIYPEDMFHLKGLGFDGMVGYSIVKLAQEAISMGLATEQFGAAFFGNGAVLGTVITAPQGVELKESAVKNLKKTFDKRHKGSRKSHGTEVLDQGMEAKMLGVPPEQAQFLETRKFQLAEIARWFGVPLHKLMSDTGVTFKNVEQLDIIFVKDVLMPWAKRWEEEVDIKLIGRDQPDLHSKMNSKGLIRGDITTRKEWYKTMFGIGAYSVNDILRHEDEDPIGPEGDIRMVPLNMATLDEAYRNGTTGRGKNTKQNSKAQLVATGAPIFVDAVTRMTRKESKVITNIASKSEDVETFTAKVTEFYQGHCAQLFEAIEPAIKAIASLCGQPVETFAEAMRGEVLNYCEASASGAVVAFETGTTDRFTNKLEQEANETAFAFLEKQLTNKRPS